LEQFKFNKYTTILEVQKEQLEELIRFSKNDPWKPIFHIHPECGLLNDPNGLSYFNKEYHVFYQWFPFGSIHGIKHWAHVKSKDLVHWERMPVAIIPTEEYEAHGAYSGSAIVKNDELLLFYTGNIKYSEETRTANQCLAIMNKKYKTSKSFVNPVITGIPEGYTGHVRDPKVWEDSGKYYMMLGAQRKNLTGTLIIYESNNAIDWNFKGELKTSLVNFGYMWECPDFFKLQGKDILVFSPQGMEKNGHDYQNLYNVIYAVGTLDINELIFDIEYTSELDKGFDFYAPQTFQDAFGRRIMFGWAGMAEIQYPSDINQWAHCLTVPRELILEDNVLKQKPVRELETLRNDHKNIQGMLDDNLVEMENDSNSYELNLEFTAIQSSEIQLTLFKSEGEAFIICFDLKKNVVSIDRQNFVNSVGKEYGYVRTGELKIGEKITARIFVDRSIVEIFLNNGDLVFTSRIFPKETITRIKMSATGTLTYHVDKYNLTRGI